MGVSSWILFNRYRVMGWTTRLTQGSRRLLLKVDLWSALEVRALLAVKQLILFRTLWKWAQWHEAARMAERCCMAKWRWWCIQLPTWLRVWLGTRQMLHGWGRRAQIWDLGFLEHLGYGFLQGLAAIPLLGFRR